MDVKTGMVSLSSRHGMFRRRARWLLDPRFEPASPGGPMTLWRASRAYSRLRESARLGTTKDRRKIGKILFPPHRKATVSPSAASKVLVPLAFRLLRTCRV